MKKIIITAVLTLLFVSIYNPLYAHGGHVHKSELSELDIKTKARTKLIDLVKKTKIDKSWKETKIIDIKKKMFNMSEEWVVSFGNENMNDIDKKILYIFLNSSGEITGANYTGK